jgi:hypothetical protein
VMSLQKQLQNASDKVTFFLVVNYLW